MRSKLIVGNWKMNGSLAANLELVQGLKSQLTTIDSKVAVAVCVPYVYLAQLQQLLAGSAIGYGAQDLSAHAKGAYTGEVSAAMLQDFAAQYVIVGHSERRSYHAETDAVVAAKAIAALRAGLKPIICVGETLQQRQAEQTKAVVLGQLRTMLELIRADNPQFLLQCTVAYEPVWAIGTGQTATPEQAQQVHSWIRQCIAEFDATAAAQSKILYGGSMNATNAHSLLSQADIDGGLIGGAALQAKDFASIVTAAK